MLDKFEIEKCILSSGKAILYDIVEGNAEVAQAVKEDKRLYGSVVFNPNYKSESLEQLRRHLDNPRFVAMKNHPDYSGQELDSKANLEILEAFHEVPLTAHVMGAARVNAGVLVAKRHPSMPVVFFHMGCPDWEYAIEAARNVDNVMLEAVASNPERARIRQAVETLGADRMLFGTDQTLLDPAYMIGMFEESGFTLEERKKIYCANSERIFFAHR